MLMAALCCTAPLAWAGDLSRLSDFDFPSGDITQNAARITQVGNHNTASIDQGPAEPGMIDRQYADIAQMGEGNQATVLQKGDQNQVRISQDGWDFAYVSQQGAGNKADLVQRSDTQAAFQRLDGNTFSATQAGNNNTINGNGINTTTGNRDESSFGPAIQSGLRNSITVVQNNDGNNLSMLQDGNDNVIIYTQNGENTAHLSQKGNGNSINYTPPAGLNVDVAQKGGESYGLSVKVN